MRIILHLPFPVSTNALWRGKNRGAYLSPQYVKWKVLAGQEWLIQKGSQPRTISGSYKAILMLAKPDNRRRDLDNYVKCVKDFVVEHGLVFDDCLCEKLYVRWGTEKEAPLGARLTLISL